MVNALESILVDHALTPALFFVEEEIVVNEKTQTPFFLLNEGMALFNPHIACIFLCEKVLVVKCKLVDIDANRFRALGLSVRSLKSFLTHIEDQNHFIILKAYHWLNWDKISRYCGQCGAVLQSLFDSTERTCLHCKLSFYPRFSPAIMVLVKKDREILLARSAHFRPGVYSAIAGFVDIGETAEMAAHREVKEELGIEITELTYFGSQTWPFPDSFMVAFTAKYARGELQVDKKELEEARWFSIDTLPTLPYSASIAHQLIRSALGLAHK